MASPDHFDAVVVGSGFGGSVTAYRLASQGLRVLVLERGKAYPPGSFPRTPHGLSRNFWEPSKGLHGMFDAWQFADLDGIVSSGLGGGSLIYANVMLRKDEHWFVHDDHSGGTYESWPVSRADLEPHYDRVEQMMAVQKYPLEQSPYDVTPKTVAFRDAAQALGLDWSLPDLAVSFANPGDPAHPGDPLHEPHGNLHGRPRRTCTLCGECDIGCNVGAKNTLDFTYLSAAVRAGAEIRTLSEVREFAPRGGAATKGYEVHYVEHTPEQEGRDTDIAALPRITVTADRLVLAAGTFGSTYLLLRNRGALPGLSAALGQGFCGNGDLLTFATNARNADGSTHFLDAARGPVITSAIRVADELDGPPGTGRGFYLEDAGVPEFATWMLQMVDSPRALATNAGAVAGVIGAMLRHKGKHLGSSISALFGDTRLSAGTLPLLGMGRDVPNGVMTLQDDLLEIAWSVKDGSEDYFTRVRDLSKKISDQLGATFVDNPLWWSDRVVSVHPLGGARMSETDATGVVTPWGEVHNHPGLYVIDGAAMPGPVGANPSLTIAALADRFSDRILEGAPSTGIAVPRVAGTDPGQPEPVATQPGPDTATVAFTEDMKGFCSLTETDYQQAYDAGRTSGSVLDFHLTIEMADIDRFIRDPGHEGTATGWVRCTAFGGKAAVERGQFNLFVDTAGDGRHKRMFYRLFFADPAGHPLTLAGFKDVHDDPGFDLWSDTSTLYTRILKGHVGPDDEPTAELLATGILHIHLLDFAKQMTTFRVSPAHRVDALARFGELFAGDLWEVYGPGRGAHA